MAANSTCLPANDNVFGPAVTGCRDGFDFTLLFEQSILSIGPSTVLIALAPVRIFQLARSSIKTLPTPIRAAKAAAALAFLAIQIALLVLWTSHSATRASIPSATLSFLDGIAILLLSSVEHTRSVRPSSLLNVYLIVSLLFDITQLRTLYLKSENHIILALSTVAVAVKAILFLLENQNKRYFLRLPYKTWSHEATSGIINRSFFWWLNPLFSKGYRSLLMNGDLFLLDQDLLSESLERQMEKSWAKYSSSGRYALVYASIWCFRWQLLMTIFPRLFLIGFNYAQPFLIGTAVDYIGRPEASRNYGYGLVGATLFIYLGIAVVSAHYQHRTYRTMTMFRGAMVSLVYARSLEIQAGAYDNFAAITLMSTDIDRITGSFQTVQDIWAKIIEIGIGIWLLERQLGWVCIAPVLVTVVCTYGAVKVASFMGPAQGIWMSAIQNRVGMTSSVLSSMKSIKMMGLSDSLAAAIQSQRVRELDLSAKFRWLVICRSVVALTPGLLGPLLTFAIFAIEATAQGSNRLSTVQAFTSLAIIALLSSPAQALLSSLPAVNTGLACFDRIQDYLIAQSWKDERIEKKLSFNGEANDGESVELRELSRVASNNPVLLVEQASVRPSKDSSLALHEISFQAAQGSLTMIIGAVGSGKTTLLKAILGELGCDSGTIRIASKKMAYCSQSPWLQNATVRQIVCGASDGLEIDMDWYNTVIYACAFDEDISQLPQGHDTLIGSRGVMLSGGQKQRLSLARAVYARQDVVLLDDVLSALDTTTEGLVLERLLGKTGIFRKLGSTVVFATHAIRHLTQADHIIVLDATGHVAEQGSFEYLRSREGFVSEIILTKVPTEESKVAKAPAKKATPLPKVLNGPSANDIADLNRRTGDISVYKYYFDSIGWKISVAVVAAVVLNTLSASFPQIWLKWYTNGTIKGVGLFASMYAVFVLTSLAMTACSMTVMFLKAIPKSGAGLHKILLTSVMRAPQHFFDNTDTGVTVNRFSQDMSLIDGSLPGAIIITLQALCNCLAMAALVSLGSSYMGLSTVGLMLFLYLLQNVYLRTSRQMRFLDLEAKSPLYTNFLETLEGLSTIRAFGWEERFKRVSNRYLDASQQPNYLMYCIQRWLDLMLQLLTGAVAVLVVGLAVNLRSTTNAGNLGIALTTILSLNTNIQFLLTWWTALETSLGAIARTKNFSEQTPSEDKPEENFEPSKDWPSKGEIEFRNVSASYGENSPALQDVSMRLGPGEKIGLCGRTGSGKSSLLSVLLRLIDMDSGTIVIDGVDLKLVPREIIRTRLVAVPQDPFILNGTVRLNADPTGSIADDRIIDAMAKVKLWDILEGRGGLDANMAKQPLSQGQQQLFSLGCALLRKHGKILILDEATSSMNLETDQLIQDLIRVEFKDHTILTVAHRLGSIIGSDKVAVLDKGRLLELGDPKALLETDSAFKTLYSQI